MIYEYIVCYKHEISLLNHAEPNQVMKVVRYNREFVIAVIFIKRVWLYALNNMVKDLAINIK